MSLTLVNAHHDQTSLGVSVDEAISFMMDALRDPLKPGWCGPCIMACLLVIQPDPVEDPDRLATLINRNHLLCSTIVAFLTVKRSITAMEKLASCWSKCGCSYADSSIAMSLHKLVVIMTNITSRNPEYSEDGKADALEVVVRNFARFVQAALDKAKPSSLTKGRHPEIWPTTPTDIIPYGRQPRISESLISFSSNAIGPETTIQSLIRWSRFLGSARVFSLVHDFVRICGPIITPAIITSRSATNYMVEHGLQICSDMFDAPLNSEGKVDDQTACIFLCELEYTGSFINTLMNLPPLLFRDSHSGAAKSAFDFATRALSTIESPIIPEYVGQRLRLWPDRLADYAAILYTILAEQMTIPKARVHSAIHAKMDEMVTPIHPAVFACEMMRHARTLRFCFAAGCPESAQSSGREYMRCSGCRIVAYCAKSCQARAWTDNELPHKDICKKMKQIHEIGENYLHREADQDKFVRAMKRAKIEDALLREIGTWLSAAYTKLQRTGPVLTPGDRQYLSQKKGPRYAEGAEEHISQFKSRIGLNPKHRGARQKKG